MATNREWLYDTTPDGTNVTTSNASSTDGANMATVAVGTGNTITFSTTKQQSGAACVKFVTGTADLSILRHPYPDTTQKQMARRWYDEFSAYPIASQTVTYAPRHSGGQAARFGIDSTGRVFILAPAGGAYLALSSGTIPLNARVRFEVLLNTDTTTTGSATITAFNGETTTVYATASVTGANFTGNNLVADDMGYAVVNPGVAITRYIDTSKVVVGASSFIGPDIAASSPTTTNSQAAAAIVTASGTAGSGGTLAYSIAQTSGTTTAPLLISAGKWAIPRHETDTLVYTITATESPSGLTATSTVSVTPAGASGDQVLIRNAANTAWV